ncbi:hypothetical protein ACFO3D_10540 [Virgibacillus kekensis]|uniref:Uncharacterized protein n=1 Tax=Virgibacillus kekensis TaxID=202261 RepID=A0ABV9DIH1_9BACI
MEKVELNQEKLIKLVKKHKKLFEHYFIKPYAYIVNDSLFYFASFERRGKTTGYAILSPNSNNESDYMKAIKPLLHYAVSIGNISNDGKYRANVDFRILYEVRDYLKKVIEGNVLDSDNCIIYQRSLDIIQNMLDNQARLINTYKNAIEKFEQDKEKGYITDDDMQEMKGFIPIFMRLQYKQFVDRYDYREDFDVIYNNRNNKEIKQFDEFSDSNTLREMTSKKAENDLKNALTEVSYGRDLRDKTDDQYDQIVMDELNKELDILLKRVKINLRNP